MRKKINFFVSYARKNKNLAESLISKLTDELRASKAHDYQLWIDSRIIVGEEWKKQIIEARNRCDFGLLLVSPAYLGSQFISENELPYFIGKDCAPSIPVSLWPVDFQFQDLKGLEALQLFQFTGQRFTEPRAYGECKGAARDAFVHALFKAIEEKLAASLTHVRE